MSTKILKHAENNCKVATDIPPLRPDQIKRGYRFGRRVVTQVHTERKHRIVHGVDLCGCRGAFYIINEVDPRCSFTEWTEYRYTVRCECGCIRIMDWWGVTHGGSLTCNRIECECTPKRFPELYRDVKSVPAARAA